MPKYYRAVKNRNSDDWERLLLSVKDRNVRIVRGETRDEFKVDRNRRPVCITDNECMRYEILELVGVEIADYKDLGNHYFSKLSRRHGDPRRLP